MTLPKPIRDLLKLNPGDAVDFVIAEDGTVQVRAGRFDVRDLRGLLKRAGRKPATVEEMDNALRAARGRS